MEKEVDKIFVEYGLDFDNNKFGLGRSVEIEYADGSEERIKQIPNNFISQRYYVRFWILKTVFSYSKDGFKIKKKDRNNFKLVFGIAGTVKN